jgi:hypothetical protein
MPPALSDCGGVGPRVCLSRIADGAPSRVARSRSRNRVLRTAFRSDYDHGRGTFRYSFRSLKRRVSPMPQSIRGMFVWW